MAQVEFCFGVPKDKSRWPLEGMTPNSVYHVICGDISMTGPTATKLTPILQNTTGWWFQIFVLSSPTWGWWSNLTTVIFFRWVETTKLDGSNDVVLIVWLFKLLRHALALLASHHWVVLIASWHIRLFVAQPPSCSECMGFPVSISVQWLNISQTLLTGWLNHEQISQMNWNH